MKRRGAAVIRNLVLQSSNRTVWRAQKGVGTFLTLDIGARHLEKNPDGSTIERSDLHFWVYLCDWTMRRKGHLILASSRSDANEYAVVLSQLIGKALDDVVADVSGQVQLHFESGFVLDLAPNLDEYGPDSDLLMVFPWEQKAIGYRSDVGFYVD